MGWEQSECRSSHMVIWTNEITTIFDLFWAKRETTGKTNQYYRKKQFQLKLVKWSKKKANTRSHLRKINEKIRQKDATHSTPWCSYPLNYHCPRSHLRTKSMIKDINPFTAEWALRALRDFTLSNARRFYSSTGNPLAGKGLKLLPQQMHKINDMIH